MSSSKSVVRTEPTDTTRGLGDDRPRARVPSFANLYKSYFDFVWSTTRYLGVEQSDIDDVVQEAFFVIHERLHTIERPESLRSWIYGVVRRIVSNHHRTKRTRPSESDTVRMEPELVQPEYCTPQHMSEHNEKVRLLWSLLNTLDAPKREVFLLTELEEMTAPEIAGAIGVPLNTVYSRLRTARQDLEEALQRHDARTEKRGGLCPT